MSMVCFLLLAFNEERSPAAAHYLTGLRLVQRVLGVTFAEWSPLLDIDIIENRVAIRTNILRLDRRQGRLIRARRESLLVEAIPKAQGPKEAIIHVQFSLLVHSALGRDSHGLLDC
jgi:hypothetical protein